jgi:hypothetical protein
MSRKRFATMIAVVLLLGAAGLISLYITLGRMNDMLRAQGRAPAADGAAPAGGEKIQEMTLTPAGESQLRAEQERARQDAQKASAAPPVPAPAPAPAPTPAKPAAAPTGASGSPGR